VAPSGCWLSLALDRQVDWRGVSRVSEDDVLFGYRLRVLDYAARTSVAEACRVFGIHRSTFYVWKRRVERHGLEILRPRERRRPRISRSAGRARFPRARA
jgi:Helix-turn-helix domain